MDKFAPRPTCKKHAGTVKATYKGGLNVDSTFLQVELGNNLVLTWSSSDSLPAER